MSETSAPATANLAAILQVTPSEQSVRNFEALAAACETLHAGMPEFAGMTVFGSTSRGEARPATETDQGSDADMYAFVVVDSDRSPTQHSYLESHRSVLAEPITDVTSNAYGLIAFDRFLQIAYESTIYRVAVEHGAPSHTDVLTMPISGDIVDFQANILLQIAEKHTKTGKLPKSLVPRNIRGLFQLGVDTAELQPYQAQLLRRLGESEYGNTAWRLIRHTISFYEVGEGREPSELHHRQVPATLEEAVEYYGPVPQELLPA